MQARARLALAILLLITAGCEDKKPATPPPVVARPPVVAGPSAERVANDLVRLANAYPEQIRRVSENEVVLASGLRLAFRNGRESEPVERRLAAPSLMDQMSMRYPAGPHFPVPTGDNDPGRLRHIPFFEAMYGANETAVRAKLVTVRWLGRKDLLVTSVNGVDKALLRVSNALMQLPPQILTCASSVGTFTYRRVAGTDYLSPHSFGIAIDLSRSCSNYWYWDKRRNRDGSFAYVNRMPIEIVLAFEHEGFIWGGKWAHYDTMHFEYRPELLIR
jgi:peptidoglycan L-alanyl-D-glutamate endopeptidase CwlK